MSKQGKKGNKSKAPQSISGATGGPSTGHGLKYQINYAQFKALDFISRALSAPHKPWAIRIEPRAVSEGGLTRWDIGTEPPEKFAEAKLNPQRKEILEWLDDVREAGTSWPERGFRFVYNEGGGPLLTSLSRLIRIANEARDQENFEELLAIESIKESGELLTYLGDEAYNLLNRIKLKNIPENVLENNISLRARLLTGEKGGKRLIEMLFTKFHNALSKRATFLINDIIAEAKKEGLNLQPPPDVDPSDLSSLAASAILVLQTCQAGLPIDVLATALGCSSSDVERELSVLGGNALHVEGQLLSIGPLPSRITRADASDIISRTLNALLTFIDHHKQDQSVIGQIHNVIALARKCAITHPKSVASIFPTLDKLLKKLGNKHIVLQVAKLSINAARRIPAPREQSVLEAEARSLICGKAWVYQRVGRVDKARVAAEESRKLAQMVGMDENLAFCVKCIGRLCRMEAEALHDQRQKESKLNESVGLLEYSIERFSQLAKFGPRDHEVGDCYSLLGRTYLELRQFTKAESAIRKAYNLIKDESSKDYLDLVILSGDLEVARFNRQEANSYYDQALNLQQSNDSEISEMRARAYFKRGKNKAALKQQSAIDDFTKAASIWDRLGEVDTAAGARWEIIRLTDNLSHDALEELEKESAAVRVAAIELHNLRLAPYQGKRIPQRAKFDQDYWKQLIREASEQVASKIVEW